MRDVTRLVLVLSVGGAAAVGCGDDGGSAGEDAGADAGTGPRDAGPPPMRDFSCVGSVTYPTPTVAEVTLTLTVEEVLGTQPLENMRVRACPRSDLACAAPVDEATSGADGVVVLMVPTGTTGFDGYFEVTGPVILQALVYTTIPVASDASPVPRLQILGSTIFELLLGVIDVTPDPARGHIGVRANDCAGLPAHGVSIRASTADASSAVFYYVDGGTPSTTATETDSGGSLGVLNVPAGAVTITLSREGVDFATTEVSVRPGFLTAFFLGPTPAP